MLNRQILLWLLLTSLISTSKSHLAQKRQYNEVRYCPPSDGDCPPAPVVEHDQTECEEVQSSTKATNETENERFVTSITNITIFVVGQSGSGISSTIRELIGPNNKCQLPNGAPTVKHFMEYTLKIPSPSPEHPDYTIKLVDVPGFVGGRTSDAHILASMKSYTYQNGFPDYYLALSRFDELRINKEDSDLVNVVKRIELFQKTLLGTASADNIVFLFTNLMSEDRYTQKEPGYKIYIFRETIKAYTSFVPPITIIVGENLGKNYDLEIEGGYYMLPNKQLYPKNVWEALFNVTSPDDPEGLGRQKILTAVMNNKENINVSCETRLVSTGWHDYDDDAYDYFYFLQQNNMTVQENEVNYKIQNEFNKLSIRMKEQRSVQKLGLQLRLQNMNITTQNDLPKTSSQNSALFHSNHLSSGVSAILLAEAFDMRMPEYNKSLAVGYGYNLITDEPVPQSLFREDVISPSNVGYELPIFLKCKKLYEPFITYYKSYSQNMSDYTKERLQYLDFDGEENVLDYKLALKLKEGFNLKPEGTNNIVNLSAIQEFHTVKCILDKQHLHLLFTEEILTAVNSMTELDRSKRDSVNEWKNFFNVFGSHIVTEGYGGGIMRGRLVGSNRRYILKSEIESDLNSIMKFRNFSHPNMQPPSYEFFGGNPNAKLYHPYDLSKKVRKSLLNAWRRSLRSGFVMQNYELTLEPISTFIKLIDEEKGEIVEKAKELLLRGDLKYSTMGNIVRSPRITITKKPSLAEQLERMKSPERLANEQFHKMMELLREQTKNEGIRCKETIEELSV